MTTEATLKRLGQLLGTWTTEATHPSLPDIVVRGTAEAEWLEGKRFLIQRTKNEHPDFPDAIWIIGYTERDRVGDTAEKTADEAPLTVHYFDSRGVFRVYESQIDDQVWRVERIAAGFSQRFTGTFADGGNTIIGRWQLRTDDAQWKDDLEITYRRK
jgi:hypothetical protein